MRNPLADKVVDIKPSGIRKFFDIVSEMQDAISLGVGEPDFDTPWHIRDEGIYSLEKGRTFYTSNAGLKDLRQEICNTIQRKQGVTYDWQHEVLVTVGGSEAIDIGLRAMCNPGDEVLIPQPSYVSYEPCAVLAGATPVIIDLKAENEFRLTAEELEAHLKELEEAKERDHRKIGKEMELFMTDDLVGRGLPMFLPKGYTVWQELENYIKDKERRLGYLHVMTPCVGTVNLYKTSGHWDHYKENMFPPMEMEGESFVLRPMNCPHHMMIYANTQHSYKDLPIRIGEIAHDFRFEASGTLKGIERGRHFCQNDAHLFVTPEQIESEFSKVVDLIFNTYKDFGITDYRCVLSLRDPEDKVKYHDDDEMWNNAENALRKVLNDLGIEYTEEIGEAAFYGPKLDVNVKPAVGNEYTLSTCQLDFCLPAKFNLTYVDKDGQKKTPVVLHRAILGSLDRFMAYILEETKGNLPLWLAPVQAMILPVKNDDEELNAYAHDLYGYLLDNNIRADIDERAEKLGYRVREAQVKKIPYLIILGKQEAQDGTISYRLHGQQNTTTVSRDEFLAMLKDEIATKKLSK